MLKLSKKMIFVHAVALAIVGAGAFSVRSVYAYDVSAQNSLVQKIAEKFSLKAEDVQAVFDQIREEHTKDMETAYEKKLSDAVSKGDLTEEKKQLILTKHKEILASMESDRVSWSSLSKAEIKAKMDVKHTELETWAKDNGIDLKYLIGGRGKGMRMGQFKKLKAAVSTQ